MAAAGRADQQDVALGDLDVILADGAGGAALQALVVVVDETDNTFLGAVLADDVLVKDLLDLVRLGGACRGPARRGVLELLADDVIAQLNAFVADEHRRSGDELAYLVLALPAERAVQQFAVVVTAAGIFSHLALVLHWRRRTTPKDRGNFLIART